MGNRLSREHHKQQRDLVTWEQARARPRDIDEDVAVPGIGVRKVQVAFAASFDPGFSWDIRLLETEKVSGTVPG